MWGTSRIEELCQIMGIIHLVETVDLKKEEISRISTLLLQRTKLERVIS